MKAKILKYELFSLFLLSIITLIVFYYREALPDNYLSISSTSQHGFFSYYMTSLFNFINYYTGPWILIPCALFTPFYVLLFSKRADWIDLFNIIFLCSFCVWTAFYLQPTLVGAGLYQSLSSTFSAFVSFSVWILSLIAFAWGAFRGGFTDKLSRLFLMIKSLDLSIVSNKLGTLSDNYTTKAREGFFPQEQNKSIEQSKTNIEEVPASRTNSNVKILAPAMAVAQEQLVEKPSPKLEVAKVVNNFEHRQELLPAKEFVNEPDLVDDYVDESQIGLSLRSPAPNEKFNEDKYYDIVKVAAGKKAEQSFSQPEEKYFLDIIEKLEAKLAQFKIEGRIINVLKGPVVDTFEWELGSGEKIAKLTSTSEDLSLALSGAPIRLVHPMKGRTTVGIEVPRNPREYIFLDEIISSKDFTNSTHQLPLAMGKDAFGEPVVVDLAAMPHMLVAGSTGAGKSVYINAVLVSLLVKKSPNQMKLILIDPKQLELALYAKLPHLLMPVVTDPKMAANSLLWACQEMERRYSIMSEFGVRNIEGFNHKLKKSSTEALDKIRKFYEYSTEDTYELPYIVVIVDEFADLMLSAKKVEIESHIARLAAKARASGIHLIIATQRPSVDVITGVIKSNFPTRVSFRVTTSTDSRTILNAMGAERLLGKGDMLYKHGVETTRIHSAYIQEEEIEALAAKLSSMAPVFNPTILEFLENGGEEEADQAVIKRESDNSEKDDKYNEAVQVVLEHRSASASLLQRRLGVGYNRAANLIEEMENNGVVGPAQGAKPRKVLLGSESLT